MQVSAGFNDTLRKVSGLLGVQAHVVDEHAFLFRLLYVPGQETAGFHL